MTSRELADLCERAPGFDAQTLQLLANTLRAQADEIKRLAEGIIPCIDASWRPNEARNWGRPELILSEYVGELLHDEVEELKAQAVLRAMQVKNLMAENERLRSVPFERGPDGGPESPCLAAYVELQDEIAALKAAAIVAGSLKLDEAAKAAKRREAVKAAWVWITGGRGWLSCMDTHDCRCPKFHDGRAECLCGADAFRRLMEE